MLEAVGAEGRFVQGRRGQRRLRVLARQLREVLLGLLVVLAVGVVVAELQHDVRRQGQGTELLDEGVAVGHRLVDLGPHEVDDGAVVEGVRVELGGGARVDDGGEQLHCRIGVARPKGRLVALHQGARHAVRLGILLDEGAEFGQGSLELLTAGGPIAQRDGTLQACRLDRGTLRVFGRKARIRGGGIGVALHLE